MGRNRAAVGENSGRTTTVEMRGCSASACKDIKSLLRRSGIDLVSSNLLNSLIWFQLRPVSTRCWADERAARAACWMRSCRHLALRQAHSALQDGQRVCRSFGMHIPLEREGKRSEDWVTASDAVKARFHIFQNARNVSPPATPLQPDAAQGSGSCKPASPPRHPRSPPEGRPTRPGPTKELTGLERARCACRAEVQPLLGGVSCNRAESRTTQRLVCRS